MIRDATIEDLPNIVDIYNAAIPGRMATADVEPVAIDSRRAWFAEHSPAKRPLWILVDGGEIHAWLSFLSFYGRPAYHATAEISVYVAASSQSSLKRFSVTLNSSIAATPPCSRRIRSCNVGLACAQPVGRFGDSSGNVRGIILLRGEAPRVVLRYGSAWPRFELPGSIPSPFGSRAAAQPLPLQRTILAE
jgi:hypothetical protein